MYDASASDLASTQWSNTQGFDAAKAKALFVHLYISTFAKPEHNIGFPGEGRAPPDFGKSCRRVSGCFCWLAWLVGARAPTIA
jgi:hypothetical protein